LRLLEVEEAWLADRGGTEVRRLVGPLSARRESIQLRMEGLSNDLGVEERRRARQRYFEELALLESQVTGLQGEARGLQANLDINPEAPESARTEIDLRRVERDLDDVLVTLDELRSVGPRSDWEDLRASAEQQFSDDVAGQRRDYRDLRRSVSGGPYSRSFRT
jgi:hypothetical protein